MPNEYSPVLCNLLLPPRRLLRQRGQQRAERLARWARCALFLVVATTLLSRRHRGSAGGCLAAGVAYQLRVVGLGGVRLAGIEACGQHTATQAAAAWHARLASHGLPAAPCYQWQPLCTFYPSFTHSSNQSNSRRRPHLSLVALLPLAACRAAGRCPARCARCARRARRLACCGAGGARGRRGRRPGSSSRGAGAPRAG